LRVPARFGQLFMLGLAVCAGYGVARLLRSRRIPRAAILVPALALLLVGGEFWAPSRPAVATPTGAAAPPVYQWLAGPEAAQLIPPNAKLLELPVGMGDRPINTNPITLMYGLAHGRPLLNGSANIIPPGYDRLFYEMRRFPTPGTLDLAQGLGVQYLVVHSQGLASDEKRADLAREAGPGGRLDLLARFPDLPADPAAEVGVYRLRPDPARAAALAAALPPGANVLLADHPGHRRLYTTVVPRLLGPDRRYFLTYSTIYTPLMPNTQLAGPGQSYPYAVFYADPDAAAVPVQYGYTEADRVWVSADGLIAVYQRGP
jgi:hypothetical protein